MREENLRAESNTHYTITHLLRRRATVSNREMEIDLAVSVLGEINKAHKDNKKHAIIVKELEKQVPQKPRFKIVRKQKQVAFPEFVDSWEPNATHFKTARKKLAEQAFLCGLSPGYYQLDEAKSKINAIKTRVVTIIDSMVEKYCYDKAVPQIISRIEAVIDRYQRSSYTIDQSLQHDVDYKREVDYAKEHKKFIAFHKDYRYLLEKFVQISPTGNLSLGKEEFKNLIALIDWLMVLYEAPKFDTYELLISG